MFTRKKHLSLALHMLIMDYQLAQSATLRNKCKIFLANIGMQRLKLFMNIGYNKGISFFTSSALLLI